MGEIKGDEEELVSSADEEERCLMLISDGR